MLWRNIYLSLQWCESHRSMFIISYKCFSRSKMFLLFVNNIIIVDTQWTAKSLNKYFQEKTNEDTRATRRISFWLVDHPTLTTVTVSLFMYDSEFSQYTQIKPKNQTQNFVITNTSRTKTTTKKQQRRRIFSSRIFFVFLLREKLFFFFALNKSSTWKTTHTKCLFIFAFWNFA